MVLTIDFIVTKKLQGKKFFPIYTEDNGCKISDKVVETPVL